MYVESQLLLSLNILGESVRNCNSIMKMYLTLFLKNKLDTKMTLVLSRVHSFKKNNNDLPH